MAQTRHPNAMDTAGQMVGGTVKLAGDTAHAVGDVAQGTASFLSQTYHFLKNTANYTVSLFNRDGGVGAAFGLAAGTAAIAAFPGLALPLIGTGAAAAIAAVGTGCAAGFMCGGHLGKARIEREQREGKQIAEPTLLNKESAMGFGLGAAAQLGTLAAMGIASASSMGLPMIAAIAGTSLLPAAGAYFGGKMGAERMTKDYLTAQAEQMQAQAASKSHGHGKGHNLSREHTPHQHKAHQSYTNTVSDEEYALLQSLTREGGANQDQGGRAAKLLADRAAAQEAAHQQQPEAQ